MIPREEISRLSYRLKINELILEKDYVLTWILLSTADSKLFPILAFKGGTALKRIYFPNYRYSEDLDFTLLEKITPENLLLNLELMLNNLSKNQGFQFIIPPEKTEIRTNSITIYIGFVGPLQARLGKRFIKIDFTLNEKIIFNVTSQIIYSEYSDAIKNNIKVYSLEEILVEKLCAMISRTEPRDFYDIDFLFKQKLDFGSLPSAFTEKAIFKGININNIKKILERKKTTIEQMWEIRLSNQVKILPDLNGVLRNINKNLRKYLYNNI